MTALLPRLLLDLRSIQKGGNYRRRANAHRHAGFYELLATLLVFALIVLIGHAQLFMLSVAGWKVV